MLIAALRATAEAAAARRDGNHEQANRQQALAASYQAMHDAYRDHKTAFAATMEDGPTGNAPRATSGSWQWSSTPNRAAATPASTGPRSAPPNRTFPPKPKTTTRPSRPARTAA